MYITKCCATPVFGTRIIDSHAHIGKLKDTNFDKTHLEPFLNKLPNGDKVEKIIVSDLDVIQGFKSQKTQNENLLKLFSNSDKYALLAACNVKEDVASMRELLVENKGKILGLKFHPHLQNVPITDVKYKPYFDLAKEQKLPCLIHTAVDLTKDGMHSGQLEKFADPKSIYEVAKNYKKTPFVMAHLGSGWKDAHRYTTDIIIESIKKGDANLYADISWVDIDHTVDNKPSKENLINAIKRLKGIGEKDWKYGDQSFRLMFGSDAPIDRFADPKTRIDSYNRYIEEIKTAIRSDIDLEKDAEKIIDDLFFNNAKKLYKIKDSNRELKTSEKVLKFFSKNIGKLAISSIVVFAGIMALCYCQDKNKRSKPNLSLVG